MTRRNGKEGPGQTATPTTAASVPDGLAVYLREAGRVPLLDWKREAELARKLDRYRRSLKSLALKTARSLGQDAVAGVEHFPRPRQPWTLDELDRFVDGLVDRLGSRRDRRTAKVLAELREHKRRLDDSRDQLVVANLRLVVHIAKKYPHPTMSLPDLVQEGNLGLMKAVEKFDHRRGNRFTTYAYWWIKQAIERAIGNQARIVRVPVHVQEKLRSIRRTTEVLRTRQKREPTTEEIARQSGLEQAKVREVLRHATHSDPLEDPERVLDHLQTKPDLRAVCPFEQAMNGQRRRKVEAALQPLAPQERQVIRLRFGLGCESRPTLESVGDAMNLSRERVRQIERQALTKLESSPQSRDLVGYLGGRKRNRAKS
jgi:RNA polymerase primary sigma factor